MTTKRKSRVAPATKDQIWVWINGLYSKNPLTADHWHIPELLARISELESALSHYADAEVVTSWGNEETADIGHHARKALHVRGKRK